MLVDQKRNVKGLDSEQILTFFHLRYIKTLRPQPSGVLEGHRKIDKLQ